MTVHHDVAVQALWRVKRLRLVEEKQGRLSSSTGAAVAAVGVVANITSGSGDEGSTPRWTGKTEQSWSAVTAAR